MKLILKNGNNGSAIGQNNLKFGIFNLINQNKGGGGPNTHSDETIEKIRSKKIGKKYNKPYKTRKEKGLKHIQYGIKIGRPEGFKYSEELKLHLSNKMKGRSKQYN